MKIAGKPNQIAGTLSPPVQLLCGMQTAWKKTVENVINFDKGRIIYFFRKIVIEKFGKIRKHDFQI